MPKKMKMAIGGPSDVETREEYKSRRMAETERGNLNRMEKVSPNPLYKDMKDKDEAEKVRERVMRQNRMRKEMKDRRNDPFSNA